eukprot:2986733-Pleurochrysis_carterae.AAC.5
MRRVLAQEARANILQGVCWDHDAGFVSPRGRGAGDACPGSVHHVSVQVICDVNAGSAPPAPIQVEAARQAQREDARVVKAGADELRGRRLHAHGDAQRGELPLARVPQHGAADRGPRALHARHSRRNATQTGSACALAQDQNGGEFEMRRGLTGRRLELARKKPGLSATGAC